MTEKLTSRKLAAVVAGIAAIVGIAVIKATWGLEDAQHYILAVLVLSGGQNVVQGVIDLRNGGK